MCPGGVLGQRPPQSPLRTSGVGKALGSAESGGARAKTWDPAATPPKPQGSGDRAALGWGPLHTATSGLRGEGAPGDAGSVGK